MISRQFRAWISYLRLTQTVSKSQSRRCVWKMAMRQFFRQSILVMNRLKKSKLLRIAFLKPSFVSTVCAMGFLPIGAVSAERMSEAEFEKLKNDAVERYVSTKELISPIEGFKQIKASLKSIKKRVDEEEEGKDEENSWEVIMDKNGMKVWRKPMPDSSLCYYRCYGRIPDVAAAAFFKVQFEDETRKNTDKGIKVLTASPVQLVCQPGQPEDDSSLKGFDQVLWVHAFPFPLKCRAYSYYRRGVYVPDEKLFVIVNKNSEERLPEEFEANKDIVHIKTYYSTMVISPLEGKSTSELGFEYVLCYVDDPQIILPNRFLTIATTDGIPKLMHQLSTAAKVIFASNKQSCIDAQEEYSLDAETRLSFQKRKQAQNPDDGDDFKSRSLFSKSKSPPEFKQRESSSKKWATGFESSSAYQGSQFEESRQEMDFINMTPFVKTILPVYKKLDRFVYKNEFIFDRISDKDNFVF